MSENLSEALAPDPTVAHLVSLMDQLGGLEDGEKTAEVVPAGGTAPALPAVPAAPDEGARQPAPESTAPADGAPAAAPPGEPAPGGGTAVPGEPAPAAVSRAAAPAVIVRDRALDEQLGHAEKALDERLTASVRSDALQSIETDYPKYVEAITKHPRFLVGQQVPKIDGTDGMETLRDSQDAKDWQDAVRSVLAGELQERIVQRKTSTAGDTQSLFDAITMFRTNPDLIPGSKTFNRELASRVATIAAPYAVRVDGKIRGYGIPVQPLIDQIRSQLAESPSVPAKVEEKADPPQAGIVSKAGSGGTDDESDILLSVFSRQTGFKV